MCRFCCFTADNGNSILNRLVTKPYLKRLPVRSLWLQNNIKNIVPRQKIANKIQLNSSRTKFLILALKFPCSLRTCDVVTALLRIGNEMKTVYLSTQVVCNTYSFTTKGFVWIKPLNLYLGHRPRPRRPPARSAVLLSNFLARFRGISRFKGLLQSAQTQSA